MRKAETVKTVLIAGAGTMGTSMAQIFAQHGFQVILHNRRQPSLDRAQGRIQANLAALEAGGALQEPKEQVYARLTFTTDMEAFRRTDYVVENIAEDLSTKQDFFRRIADFVADDVVLTSNTSGLRVTDIARAVRKPERFCGMHWWNPPHLIPLIEVTKGEKSSQEAAEIARDMGVRAGKKPVIIQKDILGIVGNRLQFAVLREALHILELGAADACAIDDVMKYGPGFRYPILGPLETADLGGLDVFTSISEYLFPDLSAAQESGLLGEHKARGEFGVKSGKGFYDYADGRGEEIIRRRDELFLKEAKYLYGDEK